MAIDVYLQIDGIKGESADSTHQGWIEVSSAQWGVVQPRSQRDLRPVGVRALRKDGLHLPVV